MESTKLPAGWLNRQIAIATAQGEVLDAAVERINEIASDPHNYQSVPRRPGQKFVMVPKDKYDELKEIEARYRDLCR